MAKKKYKNFILETDEEAFNTGENFFESREWKGVFASFMRYTHATVYGLPSYDGANYEVIMSK